MLYTYSMIYVSLPGIANDLEMPIHTYIHTLLARPHGAFQSQFSESILVNLSSFVRFMVDVFFPSIVIIEQSNCLAYISKFTTSCQERLTAGRKEPN